MSWADDKARIAELGVGPMLLCSLLILLTILGVLTLSFVWQTASRLGDEYPNSPEMTSAIWRALGWAALRPVLFLTAAATLFFSRGRWAVIFTIGVIFLTNYNSVLLAPKVFDELRYGVSTPVMLADVTTGIAMLLGIPAYLLLSKEIDLLYGFGSRRFIVRGTANLWQRFRNRPSLDEIEAERLNETFN